MNTLSTSPTIKKRSHSMFQGYLSIKIQCLKIKQNLQHLIEFEPNQEYEVKFRVSIIEQIKKLKVK